MANPDNVSGEIKDGETLEKQLFAQLGTGKYCDVTFRVGEDTYHAHRVVLATRCHYFASMFFGNFKEASNKEVDMTKSVPSITSLKMVIQYLYLQSCDISSENVIEILHLASLIWLDELREKCSVFLLRCLKPNNCVPILASADLFNLNQLTMVCSQMLSLWNNQIPYNQYTSAMSVEYFIYLNGIKAFRNMSVRDCAVFMYCFWKHNMKTEIVEVLERQTHIAPMLECLVKYGAEVDNCREIVDSNISQLYPVQEMSMGFEINNTCLKTLCAIIMEEDCEKREDNTDRKAIFSIAVYLEVRKEWVKSQGVALPHNLAWSQLLTSWDDSLVFRMKEEGKLLLINILEQKYEIISPPNGSCIAYQLESESTENDMADYESPGVSVSSSDLPSLEDDELSVDIPIITETPKDCNENDINDDSSEEEQHQKTYIDPHPYIFLWKQDVFCLSRVKLFAPWLPCPTCQGDVAASDSLTCLTLSKLNSSGEWFLIYKCPVADTLGKVERVSYSVHTVKDSEFIYLTVTPSGSCCTCKQTLWFSIKDNGFSIDMKVMPVLPDRRTNRQESIDWSKHREIRQMEGMIGITRAKLIYGLFYHPGEERWIWKRSATSERADRLDGPAQDCSACKHDFKDCEPELLLTGLSCHLKDLCPHYKLWEVEGCGGRIWHCDGLCGKKNESMEEVPSLPDGLLKNVKIWKEVPIRVSFLKNLHAVNEDTPHSSSDEEDNDLDGPLAGCEFIQQVKESK